MKSRILTVTFGLLIAAVQGPAQSQPQGLRLSEVRIGMDKQAALTGLRINYELTPIPFAGVDGYVITSKNSKDEAKGQINFSRGIVASVSEQIGGPYLDRNTINIVRDLHRLLAPYGKKAADGRSRASIEVQFDDRAMAGFGDAVNISFRVESGRQIQLGFVVPDDPSSGAPSAQLSVFRNAP